MSEMAWVRRLAGALVRGDSMADDVAQDAWIVANDRQPSTDRPLRPWLSRVVGNLARTRRRAEHRRDANERAAVQVDDRVVATPDELIERVELHRVLADEVLALDEPYRSTVLLHFFEGVTSADLARRLGVPDGTVRRRLKVALDKLRDALAAREQRDRRDWLKVLVPLAAPPASPATLIGAVAVKKVAVVVALAVAIAFSVAWWLHASPTPPPGASHPPTALFALDRADDTRPVPSWMAQADVAPRVVAGHVLADGVGVANADVELALRAHRGTLVPIAHATTNQDGAFDFGPQPAALLVISASASQHAPASLDLVVADPHVDTTHVAIALGGCASKLVGSVRDSGAGAIAHAHIASAGLGGVESNADGSYELCFAPADTYGQSLALVRVAADGYGAIEEPKHAPGELHHDFVLVPEAVLVGRVIVGDQPVAHARVTAIPEDGSRVAHRAGGWAESDDDGRFRIAGLSSGKFEVSAVADHLGTATPVLAVAEPAATSREIHVALTAFARVRGHVVMRGEPVAGAKVSTPKVATPAISQSDGSFVLDGVPYGTASFVAPPYRVRQPSSLAIAAADVEGIEIEVSRLATVHGHVTRSDKPVADAHVGCAMGGGRPERTAIADANGAYVVDGLFGGVISCIAYDPVDRAFVMGKPVRVAAEVDTALDLAIDSAARVQGEVVDAAGAPVAGVFVVLTAIDRSGDECQAMTDSFGAFDCGALAGGGEYAVAVDPSPATRQGLEPVGGGTLSPIVVPDGDGVVTGVRLAIKNERVAITGRVVDASGAPIADVEVAAVGHHHASMNFPTAFSDADGHFAVTDLAPGSYLLHGRSANGGAVDRDDVEGGGSAVTLMLIAPGSIAGTLVGFTTTPTIHLATLVSGLSLTNTAIVDGATFSAINLIPGHYMIDAQSATETTAATLDVASGQVVNVTLTAHSLGTVAGRVVEFGSDLPVAGMSCRATLSVDGAMSSLPEGDSRLAISDADGTFQVAAPIGRARVLCSYATSNAMSLAGTDVDVVAGSIENVALVSVRATYGNSPGYAGFSVTPLTLPLAVKQVDANGPAQLADLEVGDVITSIDGTSTQECCRKGLDRCARSRARIDADARHHPRRHRPHDRDDGHERLARTKAR